MLGLEPLYLACEGRLVFFVPAEVADKVVDALRKCENSEKAAIIGEVTDENKGKVILNTAVGARTILSRPSGELLPRIC
jgi:hydrogenase expression/formation protein HypE